MVDLDVGSGAWGWVAAQAGIQFCFQPFLQCFFPPTGGRATSGNDNNFVRDLDCWFKSCVRCELVIPSIRLHARLWVH